MGTIVLTYKVSLNVNTNRKMASSGMEENDGIQLPKPNISDIKNKQRRQELYIEMKKEKRKMKLKEKKRKKKEAEELGDEAPPKQIPRTIENTRVYDETMVDPEDEEVAADEANDEIAPYFNRATAPKILLTTALKISS